MSRTTKDKSGVVLRKLVVFMVFTMTLLSLSGCKAQSQKSKNVVYKYSKATEYFPGKQWSRLASPELAGWSIVKLEQARQFSNSIHSAAVIIVDNGVIVAEWGHVTTRYKLHSVRKSIMSAMVGIYVDQKKLHLTSTLKQLKISDIGGLSPVEESATVEDLLTARSGVYHPAAYETDRMREKRPPRGSHKPRTFWFYNNWDFNALLTIFNQETGMDFFKAFEEKIADPLQMEQFRLRDTSYYYERDISRHPAYLFRMSALDLARFGLLFLRNGRWKDQQIISSDWVHRSTERHTVFNPKHPLRGYGYLWWIGDGLYYAAGTGGQRLFVLPDAGIVIVHRVDTDSRTRVGSKKIWILFDKIMSAKENK